MRGPRRGQKPLLLKRERQRTGGGKPEHATPPPPQLPFKEVLQELRETWGGRGLRLLLCGLGPTPGQGALLTGAFQGEVTIPAQAYHLACSPSLLPVNWPQGGKSYSPGLPGFLCKQPGRHLT